MAFHHSANLPSRAVYENTKPLGGKTKRIFDISLSVIAITTLTPLLLFISILIVILDGGPAIIRHERIGRSGSAFRCLKFRTMIKNSEEILRAHLAENPNALQEWTQTHKLIKDPRITKFGRILRKTSLDELPQIFNILIGDMSFVGPRPIVYDEIKKYGPAFTEYQKARPGLTGAWQVSGRNDIAYDDRIELDRKYIKGWSMWLDTSILIKTIPAVIRAKGVY